MRSTPANQTLEQKKDFKHPGGRAAGHSSGDRPLYRTKDPGRMEVRRTWVLAFALITSGLTEVVLLGLFIAQAFKGLPAPFSDAVLIGFITALVSAVWTSYQIAIKHVLK